MHVAVLERTSAHTLKSGLPCSAQTMESRTSRALHRIAGTARPPSQTCVAEHCANLAAVLGLEHGRQLYSWEEAPRVPANDDSGELQRCTSLELDGCQKLQESGLQVRMTQADVLTTQARSADREGMLYEASHALVSGLEVRRPRRSAGWSAEAS